MGGIVYKLRIFYFAFVISTFAVAPISAQETEERIYSQEFEKAGLYKVIDNWDKVPGTGYPFYNTVELEFDKVGEKNAHGGKGYLIMTTLGSSTAYEIDRKIINIDPQKSYVLKAYVKMANVESNRAYISLRWYNNKGDLIYEDKSTCLTKIFDWTELTLNVDNVSPDTSTAQIRLNFEGADLHGKCFWDDIALIAKPKIIVDSLGHKGNIFNSASAIKFKLTLPSLKFTNAELGYVVKSYDGVAITTSDSHKFDPVAGDEISFSIKEVGYYEVLTTIRADGKIVNTKRVPFTVVSNAYVTKETVGDFGVIFNPYRYNFENTPFFISTLGVEKMKLVVWDVSSPSRKPPSFTDIHHLAENLWVNGCQPMAVIAKPPRELFKGVSKTTIEAGLSEFFGLPKDVWGERLTDIVVDLSEFIQYWQIGLDGTQDALPGEIFRKVKDTIKSKKEFSSAGIPVDFVRQEEIEGANFYAIDTRKVESPKELAETQARFNLPSESKPVQRFYTLGIKPLSAGDRYQAIEEQLEDIIKKCVIAKKIGAENIFLPLEEDDVSGLLNSEGIPNAIFLALKNVNDVLSDVKYEDKHIFTSPTPIKDFVFRKGSETVIAIWSDSGDISGELYLGDEARIVEPLGKVTSVTKGKPVTIGKMPKFIIGINSKFVDTQLSLNFEPVEIALRGKTSKVALKFKNAFDVYINEINVDILKSPKGWFTNPSPAQNSLAGKSEFNKIVNILVPQTQIELSGEFTIDLSFKVGDKAFKSLLFRRIDLKPQIDAAINLEESAVQGAKKVSIKVINNANRRLNLKLILKFPTTASIEVNGVVGEGESPSLFEYLMPNYAEQRGKKVSVQIFDAQGDIFRNKELTLE